MTSPLSPEREAEIRARAEAATEGPWQHQPWSTYALPSGDYAESILLAAGAPDGELTRGLPDADGEFIAHSRADVPVLLAALDRERAEKARILAAHHAQSRAVEETLARALGFVEDPEYGFATGDHTPVTLADEIAGRLEKVCALADDTGAWSAGDARPRLILAMLRGDL